MMNTTQKVIILVGNPDVLQDALEVIRGFKACTLVKHMSAEIVENVFKHNKNVVHATRVYSDLNLDYSPVIVKVTRAESDFPEMELGLENLIEDFPKLMDTLNIDVGDHICNDSAGLKKDTANCMICNIVEGHPQRKEHIIYQSKNFFVVPGLGAFYDGYVMLCPRRHVMSFAELNDEEHEEFLQVLDDIRYILKYVYHKEIFVFECGSGRNGGGKHATSIVHAHIHFAPTDMPVLKCVQKSGIHPGLICPNDLHQYGEYPYMLYIDQEDNWYIASDPNSYYPRQHPRQVLADYMGLARGEYNWRKFDHIEKMEQIYEEIASFLRANFDKLPSWMKSCVKNYIWKKV